VTVYYNPKHPEIAVLERGIENFSTFLQLCLLITAVALSGFLAYWSYKKS